MTAYLLLAASKVVDGRAACIGSPAHQVSQGAAVPAAYLPAYESDLRALWHHTLQHAREAAGLSHDDVLAYQRATGRLLGSPTTDAEFRAALQWAEKAGVPVKPCRGCVWTTLEALNRALGVSPANEDAGQYGPEVA